MRYIMKIIRIAKLMALGMFFHISLVFAETGNENEADLILFNGKIITVDSQNSIFKAIAVKNGKIVKLGTDAEIKPMGGSNCTYIDLNGKTVTPGLVDSHYHLMYYGQQFWPGYLNIRHPAVRSKADLLKVVGDRAKQIPPDTWISGNQGFYIPVEEPVDKTDLDAVSPNNPVYLKHGSGQYAVVNSKAVNVAGVTKSTPNPVSSFIGRDSNGNPNGILSHYPAENLVGKFATGYGDRSVEQKIEDIEQGQKRCLEAGYTSVQDVIVGNTNDILLFKDFSSSGKLKVRLYTMLYLNTEEQVNYQAANFKPGNSGMFTFGGWKLAMDGGLAAKTMLMYDTIMLAAEDSYPYFDQPTLNRMVSTLHKTGLQVAVHVSGDRGIDMTINAMEEAMKNNPRPDPRHRIEHGQFPTDSALQHMKNSRIILSTQPQWIMWHGDGYAQVTSAEAMNHLLPLKKMLGMGIPLAFGCDVPASIYQEPKYAFAGAVYRRTSSGTTFNQDQCLTMTEALRIHTMGSAYAGFSESMTGSLEPGKYADLVVWSHDLLTMPQSDVLNLKSILTIVNGLIGYNAGQLFITTSVSGDHGLLNGFGLSQNYPNPFHEITSIHFRVPVTGNVEISIYDISGRKVTVLANELYPTGNHSVSWQATDDSGELVKPGLYICEMRSGNYVSRKKIVFIQ